MLSRVGPAARHRRAGRAGGALLDPGHARTIPFMGFATGRFIEVAAKLGISLEDAGLTGLQAPIGFGLGRGGMPLMTAGAECYAFVGGPCGSLTRRPHPRGLGGGAGGRPDHRPGGPRRRVGQPDRDDAGPDNGLLRYDLEEACAILREPCPCGETSIRGLWGGRFKDLLVVPGDALPGGRGRGSAA